MAVPVLRGEWTSWCGVGRVPFRPGSPHPHPDGKDFTARSGAWPTKRSGIRHLPAPRTCTTSERLVSGCGGLAGRMEGDQQAQTLAAGNEVGSGGTPCTSLWVSMTNTTTCGSAAASTTARGVRQVTPGAPVDSFHNTPLIRAGGESVARCCSCFPQSAATSSTSSTGRSRASVGRTLHADRAPRAEYALTGLGRSPKVL